MRVSQWLITVATLVFACTARSAVPSGVDVLVAVARNGQVLLEFDAKTRTRVVAKLAGRQVALGPFSSAETVVVNGKRLEEFELKHHEEQSFSDGRGAAQRLKIIATAGEIEKEETVDSFANFPTMLFVNVRYTNRGSTTVSVEGWRNQAHIIHAGAVKNGVAFWSLERDRKSTRLNSSHVSISYAVF